MHTFNSRIRSNQKGFTLIELLVVIAIIALLMGILMPALSRVKSMARAAACQSNLHQWAVMWSMYADDNDGSFHPGRGGTTYTADDRWPTVLRYYYKDDDIRLCPMATKPSTDGGQNPFCAWGRFDDGMYASYGINEWLLNRPVGSDSYSDNYWRKLYNIKLSSNVPLFLDCRWYDVWAFSIDEPPPYDGADLTIGGKNEMWRVCLNRHNYAVNSAFLDWTVRKVNLKQLWTLKWHKNYNTKDMWTTAGGAVDTDWPEWMRGLKAY